MNTESTDQVILSITSLAPSSLTPQKRSAHQEREKNYRKLAPEEAVILNAEFIKFPSATLSTFPEVERIRIAEELNKLVHSRVLGQSKWDAKRVWQWFANREYRERKKTGEPPKKKDNPYKKKEKRISEGEKGWKWDVDETQITNEKKRTRKPSSKYDQYVIESEVYGAFPQQLVYHTSSPEVDIIDNRDEPETHDDAMDIEKQKEAKESNNEKSETENEATNDEDSSPSKKFSINLNELEEKDAEVLKNAEKEASLRTSSQTDDDDIQQFRILSAPYSLHTQTYNNNGMESSSPPQTTTKHRGRNKETYHIFKTIFLPMYNKLQESNQSELHKLNAQLKDTRLQLEMMTQQSQLQVMEFQSSKHQFAQNIQNLEEKIGILQKENEQLKLMNRELKESPEVTSEKQIDKEGVIEDEKEEKESNSKLLSEESLVQSLREEVQNLKVQLQKVTKEKQVLAERISAVQHLVIREDQM